MLQATPPAAATTKPAVVAANPAPVAQTLPSDLPACFAGIDADFALKCPRTVREYVRGRNWMPGENSIAELQMAEPQITALCAAATMPCEWGGDLVAHAPDLARLKVWMAILDADSRRLERFSKRMESSVRIIAMLNIARIVAQVPRLDMQREASRFGWQAIQRAEQFAKLSFDAAIALSIRDAAKEFGRAQDAAANRCVQFEQTRWIARPQQQIRLGADGASLYLAAQSESAGLVSTANEYPLSRLQGDELLIEMRTGDAFFTAIAAVWKAPDATMQVAALSQRAERGEFGAWIAAARPDFLTIRGEITRGRGPLLELCDAANVVASRPITPAQQDSSQPHDQDATDQSAKKPAQGVDQNRRPNGTAPR